MSLVANFVGFQVGWFACVLGAANNMPLLGSLIAFFLVIHHLYRLSFVAKECCLILVAIVVGFIWETVVVNQDFLFYPSSSQVAVFAPHWLVMMWALFATTINVSMGWLKRRWGLAVILGAIFGPMAFLGGEKLGAVVFLDATMALIVLSLGWAMLMPLMLWIADYINGFNPAGETMR
jgi:uncharacterized membrane protein YqjE